LSTRSSERAMSGLILPFKGKWPKIADDCFIAPTATIIGDVEIGPGSSIWFGTVLRGDYGAIRVGAKCSVQDNAVLHTDLASPLAVGDNVTIGHSAVVHGCTIEDDCLIGIGSIVLNDALVKESSVVASGSVVRQRQVVGPRHLVAGAPAVVKRELAEVDIVKNREVAETYRGLAERHLSNPRSA